MTVYVPTSVASVTVHASGDLGFDHTHAPTDRPDLVTSDGWALECDPVCERGVVSGFAAWRDGDADVIEADGRVDVYCYGVTASADEVEDDDPPPPAVPAAPVFNVTLPSITVNAKQKRQKRTRVTVEAASAPNVTVQPQITVEQPATGARRTSVRRRKDGTMIVESKPHTNMTTPHRRQQ